MISFTKAVSFAFNKRSFIIGSVLLFLTFMAFLICGYAAYKYELNILQLNWDSMMAIVIALYIIKSIFWAGLTAYFLILAKKEVYNQPRPFSKEFFVKVSLELFVFSFIFSCMSYMCGGYVRNWFIQKITYIQQYSDLTEGIKVAVISLLGVLLILHCINSFYMAWVMNFNFSNFIVKLKTAFMSFMTTLKMIGWAILFSVLSLLPIIALLLLCSLRAFVMEFASFFMGATASMSASMSLFLYALFMGVIIFIFCIATKGGRIFGVCVSLCYLILYGIFRLMGLPEFPFSVLLYIYVFFVILTLLFVIFSIVYPCFWLHLLAQGALEANRKFEPSVGLSDEEKLSNTNSTQDLQPWAS